LTRLKESDICRIPSRLEAYNRELVIKTGKTLLQIACHACNVEETIIRHQIDSFKIHVVPVTAGQGIITDFSETVAAILNFLGFNAGVSDKPDTTGLAMAFEDKADAVMMADDHRFVGINLNTRYVADNGEATGRVFAAALDLMAKGIKGRDVLVMGCGPVGEAAARAVLSLGGRVTLFDTHVPAARLLKQRLSRYPGQSRIQIEDNLTTAILHHDYILEATPSEDTIPDELISDHLLVAAPGVPLGISDTGCQILGDRLVHDKLELGVAAMAVLLVS